MKIIRYAALAAVLLMASLPAFSQAGMLACVSGSTIAQCGPNASTNIIGVFQPGNQGGIVASAGLTSVNLASAVATIAGDYACTNAVGGTIVDNGLVQCPAGQQVGYIDATNPRPDTSAQVFLHFTSEFVGASFEVNGSATTSQSPINFINGSPTNGLTLTFANPSSGNVQLGLSGVLGFSGGGTGLSSLGSAGQCLQTNSGATAIIWGTCGGGAGTVTSVGLALPSIFTVSGSPVTSAGTLTGTLATESANLVFAGPSSGAAAAPTFRSLVAADIPALSYQATLSTYAAPAHNFLTGFTSPNTFTATQPGFSDLTGTATDAQLANAYSGVGACTAGQYVSGLTRNAAPTCGTPAGGSFTAGGDLSGTSTSQSVIGLHFGATGLSLGTVPTSGQCLEYNGTNITGAACSGGSGVTSITGDLALISNSASTGAVTVTLANAPAQSLWGNATTSAAAPGYTSNAALNSLLLQPGTLAFPTLRVFGETGGVQDIARFVTHTGAYGVKIDTNGDLWVGNPTATTGHIHFSNGAAGGADVNVQNNAATTAYNFNLPATAGTAGQLLTSGGGAAAPMTWSSALANPMTTLGDTLYGGASGAVTRLAGPTVNGTYCTQEVVTASAAVAPTWGACGAGGITGWTQNGTTGTVLAKQTSGQDAPILQLQSNFSGAQTADYFQIYDNTATPSNTCVSNADCIFWIDASKNMNFTGNVWKLGSPNQSTASYSIFYGGASAGAYDEFDSGQIASPSDPAPTAGGTGTTITAATYSFEWTYKTGIGNTTQTKANSGGLKGVAATAGQQLTLPLPAWIPGVNQLEVYGEQSTNGTLLDCGHYDFASAAWSGTGCGSGFAVSGANLTVSSWTNTTTGNPPATNDTAGAFLTRLAAGAEGNGYVCALSVVPAPDCPNADALLGSGGERLNLAPTAAGSVTAGDVVSYSTTTSASAPNLISNAAANATNFAGVAEVVNKGIYVAISGLATVNLAASAVTTAGDFACTNATAGTIVDSATPCAAGQQVGIIAQTNGTAVTSVPVQLTSAQGVSGGTGSLPAMSGATANLALSNNGSTASWVTLTVPGGGTGLATLTANTYYTGNGTSAMSAGSLIENPTFSVATSDGALEVQDPTSGYEGLTYQLKATAALTAGELVCPDTANDNSVIVCPTTTTDQFIGSLVNSPGAGAQANVIAIGRMNLLMGTGTCARGNYVVADTTTAGDVKCTATKPSTVDEVGEALTAQGTVGGIVSVNFDKRSATPAPGTQTIASGTATLGTSPIASGVCGTVVTVAAPGVATTDVVSPGFNGDPSAVIGYGVSATGAVLTVYPYPTSGNVNFKVCNSTSASITPGALTLNWRVTR